MALLGRISYLKCGVIHGQALSGGVPGDHAWNMLKISGAYTLLDVTFNDQDAAGLISYAYFNLTDGQMNADHMPESKVPLPSCRDETVGWHARQGLYVPPGETEAYMLSALAAMAETGRPLHLRFAREEDYRAMADDPQRWLDRYSLRALLRGSGLTGATSFYYMESQLCLMALPAK